MKQDLAMCCDNLDLVMTAIDVKLMDKSNS